MRQHKIDCNLEGEKGTQYLQHLQNVINEYAVKYIEICIIESDLSKHEKICLLEELVNSLKLVV